VESDKDITKIKSVNYFDTRFINHNKTKTFR